MSGPPRMAPGRARGVFRGVLCSVVAGTLAACGGPQDMLDPRGPAAARVEDLWWVLFAMGVGVSVVVTVLLLLAIRRSRRRERGEEAGEINGRALVWIGAGVLTPIILLALVVYSFRIGAEIYPPTRPDGDLLTVEVVGHQYWWEVRYPGHDVVTANEIHIPVGRPVRFLVTARDVIHSFWIPQLHGKIDMVPGHTTRVRLEATEPGRFRGQCAEFCGASHALMALWVHAVPEAEFAEWIGRQGRSDPEPAGAQVRLGRQVFSDAGCDVCHATRGSPLPPERGEPGPDLTHVASRTMLAAGTLANTRGNLAAWILEPERIKPGARMPGTRLPAEQLDALLAYLESLR